METEIKKITVEQFLDGIGRSAFQLETGYSTQLVQRAKDVGVFPSHWFWAVRDFCNSRDAITPEHLFRGHPEAKSAVPKQKGEAQ